MPDSSVPSCVSLGERASDLGSLPLLLLSPRPPGCAHSPSEGGRVRRPGLGGCGPGTGLWRCPPDPETEALFSGELAALGGCDIEAQPVDQQDPGVGRSGPAGTPALLRSHHGPLCGRVTCQRRGSPKSSGDILGVGTAVDKPAGQKAERRRVWGPPSGGEGSGDPCAVSLSLWSPP